MPCPICNSNAPVSASRPAPGNRYGRFVECGQCGSYFASEEAVHDLPGTLRGDPDRIARVAYGVRRMGRGTAPPFLTTNVIENLLATPLPSVFEQANNLILWVGEQATGPGENVDLDALKHRFVVGAKAPAGFEFLVTHLRNTGVLVGSQTAGGFANVGLTFGGWEHFHEIQRGTVDSRKAFMAMQYGEPEIDRMVNDVFRPAVAQTGFTLVRLDDQPRAGLIDDRLRVEIRASRFLVADLTHQNAGAYWEAGYAEGLGKPVIYTCEQTVFEREQTHFDTNHHLTVIWDSGAPDRAAEQLKATIRATLPDVAKLED